MEMNFPLQKSNMAAQCDVNTAVQQQQQQQQHFISSNVYHGYVPVPVAAQTFPSDGGRNGGAMDVDAGDVVFDGLYQQRQQFYMQQRQMRDYAAERCFVPRKRTFDSDEVAAYRPCFKRFREETVVTNVFQMVQESAMNGAKTTDIPIRCTISHHY